MAKWIVADSLYSSKQWFCSHLDSYSHYLQEYGEEVEAFEHGAGNHWTAPDVLFMLDQYDHFAATNNEGPWRETKKIAQVAAICSPMPWEVRRADGSPVYDLVISSLRWMVDEARKHGCRAEWMPLAFDNRALVAGMGIKERDIPCLFLGTTGGNHQRRTKLLAELGDVVTVERPTFGREMFRLLARARCVLNIHAEWARGEANNMRLYESAGMGCEVVSDGDWIGPGRQWWFSLGTMDTAGVRACIRAALGDYRESPSGVVRDQHTYENRIPRLVELARSL